MRVLALIASALALSGISLAVADSPDTLAKWELPHGSVKSLKWKATPGYGGSEAVMYRSPDGTRVAGAFTHSGSYSFTYPFDEFVVILSGSVDASIVNGPKLSLKKGDLAYFKKGMTVHFKAGKNYSNAAMMVSENEITW